ncbi:VWA domain-containing protein [Dethiobacter alkaliphilus]|uniref:von Willebrand factor type A n=1 Tax=Dethiobacter alkaliphilus AHT 1 TaxID=555088 RepID=C0GE98_DETAL|nr:VWA domain-containing protein [Dethiobacter alkaliphilus]EEG78392.1 von Willebrand factor type A [Dethiobacter alkaliphilus AHT 1]
MLHRFRSSLIKLVVFAMLLSTLAGAVVQARSGRSHTTEALSVILVVDISGSMDRNDPQYLRETATLIFMDLLGPKDYLGVLAFDDRIEELVPLQQVADNKGTFKEAVEGNLVPRGFTDYVGALEEAFEQLHSVETGDARQVVVFLTDGEPNPHLDARNDDEFMEGYLGELWDLTGEYAAAGVPVYPVAFSDEVGPEVLEQIAGHTGADFVLMPDPGDLVVTFFELVSRLKNRNLFFANQEAGGETVEFAVSENTRQVNIVAIAEAGGVINMEMSSPLGTVTEDSFDGLVIEEYGSSMLVVLNDPGDYAKGSWSAVFDGARVSVMADTEQFVSARLLEPLDSGQYPLNEPLPVTVEVTTSGGADAGDVQAVARITKPGEAVPVTVSLQETDGLFHGEYEDTNQQGVYIVEVELSRQGEVIASASAEAQVQLLPYISTDFWAGEGYRLGEEIIVTGTLSVAGNRLPEGGELSLDYFRVEMEYENGEVVSIPLKDSGDYEEHGDVRSDDGIWSNRFVFEHPGQTEAYLRSSGTYRGADFTLERRLGAFTVLPQGTVEVTVENNELWTRPGGNFRIPVAIVSNSSFAENVILTLQGDAMLEQTSVELEPGETRMLDLAAVPAEDLPYGSYSVTLLAESDEGLTQVEVNNGELSLDVLTTGEALQRRFLGSVLTVGSILVVLLVIALMVYLLGMVLYRLIVYPQTRLRGALSYRLDPMHPLQELSLTKSGKTSVKITLDEDNRDADFLVSQGDHDFTMSIYTQWDNRLPKFLQGWRTLVQREIPVKVLLECEKPGVIEFEGEVYTKKELFHLEEFTLGNVTFQYINSNSRWFKNQRAGVDILKGKV